ISADCAFAAGYALLSVSLAALFIIDAYQRGLRVELIAGAALAGLGLTTAVLNVLCDRAVIKLLRCPPPDDLSAPLPAQPCAFGVGRWISAGLALLFMVISLSSSMLRGFH